MRRTALLLAILLSACGLALTEPLSDDLATWAEANKDMLWDHTLPADDPPPDLPLERFEVCGDFGIAFFDSSDHRLFLPDDAGGFIDDDLLWVAGLLSDPPDRVDGGFVASVQDPILSGYRTDHGPCQIAFERWR